MQPVTDPAELFLFGNILLDGGDAHGAIDAFRRCLDVAPNHAATHYNLGNALVRSGQPVEAVDAFVTCLHLNPQFGAAYVNLATTLQRLALLDQAQAMAELAVHHLPDEPEAKVCLAGILHDKADYAAAARLYLQALDHVPHHAGALTSLGNTLAVLGHFTQALAMHDRAVAAAPGDAEPHFNRATTRLAAGDFANGWADYEWRWQRAELPPRGFGDPWRGEDIAGRTILLHAEQGLGDTLQFVRYAPLVAARNARVVLEVQPPLARLMQTLPGVVQGDVRVVTQGDPLPAFDRHCPLLSLPLAFATRIDSIPASTPYLHGDRGAIAGWAAHLPDDGGLRVGLVWAGSPHINHAASHLVDRRRSLPPAALAGLADIGGVHLVSLQKDTAPPPDLRLINPMPSVTDFADTAALVANLDLVITVDTAVAHLAGALGRPVWLLSRYDGSWRWLHGRDDSPWYPGMRIYRQPHPNDWADVVARVHTDLSALARRNEGL